MKTCLKCGAQLADDALFCMNCGFKDILVCPGCGTDRKPGAVFCGNCGARYYTETEPAARQASVPAWW